ncbi:hypothetical protein [uncultured Paraglaciecola sp.]|uniref:hypothetical protein n=1 Tax=uncultured Paraglaciecola sp. TaxID=1765024 RepID=UPI0030DA0CDA|tara:strand:- start:116022 stop:116384 length:363 start_codon:yes stop_codon:yes gene_type:complete
MSYLALIKENHIYVKYAGVIDGLDMVQITADENFINNMRRLQNVIHDFSFCDEVSLGVEDMQEIALMSNLESNFTEKAKMMIIPRTPQGFARISAFSQAIKSPDWRVLAAQNYEEALTKL